MPRMTSPDATEVLTIPEDGVAPMKALGWTVEGTESTGGADRSGGGDKPRRGPGRPRKNPEPEPEQG